MLDQGFTQDYQSVTISQEIWQQHYRQKSQDDEVKRNAKE